MKTLSTPMVVKLVDIHPITLERWLRQNSGLRPKTLQVGNRAVRLWRMADVARLKRFKVGQKPGPKLKPNRKAKKV